MFCCCFIALYAKPSRHDPKSRGRPHAMEHDASLLLVPPTQYHLLILLSCSFCHLISVAGHYNVYGKDLRFTPFLLRGGGNIRIRIPIDRQWFFLPFLNFHLWVSISCPIHPFLLRQVPVREHQNRDSCSSSHYPASSSISPIVILWTSQTLHSSHVAWLECQWNCSRIR